MNGLRISVRALGLAWLVIFSCLLAANAQEGARDARDLLREGDERIEQMQDRFRQLEEESAQRQKEITARQEELNRSFQENNNQSQAASLNHLERIIQYDVDILVQTSGDIEVSETIKVNALGRQIRRGIFRDLPRLYDDPETEGNLRYRYDVKSVRRNGSREPYNTMAEGNAYRILIGDEDRFLKHGEHIYEIKYHVKNAVSYQDGFDELYWNAIGHYWQFPILEGRVSITLPEGVSPLETSGFSGREGRTWQDFDIEQVANKITYTLNAHLARKEGLTVSISIPKGVIEPPSTADKGWLWWARNGSLTALGMSLIGLFGFLFRSFDKVGRDPKKPPVFARYEPPKGYSPAAVSYIYHRRLTGHDGLIANIMQLAVTGHIDVNVEETSGLGKKDKTTLKLLKMPEKNSELPKDTAAMAREIFPNGRHTIILDGETDTSFSASYRAYLSRVRKRYGKPYFKWNRNYSIIGISASLLVFIFASSQPSAWTIWHSLAVIGLILLNIVFMYLMPAPSKRGQRIRTEIEGFKLYLEKAEKLQLNAAEIGGGPPPMSQAHYEAFLPYAIALGVEKPWTKHFEKIVPEAADYNPSWTNMGAHGFRSLGSMNTAMSHSISSGVSSAMPSSSGSGSGGGGFSGGGGGGGGGGGW